MARRTGLIARLPRDIREHLNLELENGLPYSEICLWLAEEGYPGFNKGHISSWYKGGYQDWLRDIQRLEELNERMDYVRRFNFELDGDTFQEASLKVAAIQFFEVLNKLDVNALQEKLAEKPELYLRLINSLCRLTKSRREFLAYQQEKKQTEQPSAFDLFKALLRSRKKAEAEDGGLKMEDSKTDDGERKTEDGGAEDIASQSEPVRAGTSGCELKPEGGGEKAEDRGLRIEDSKGGGQRTEGLRPSCRTTGVNGKGDRPACGTELQTKRAAEGGAPAECINAELRSEGVGDGGESKGNGQGEKQK
ncbi:MAG: hypothetical protein JWQ71_1261 [Pedosphaera sp.]|nr:hypothetical protein [Pedosphaera sp.]